MTDILDKLKNPANLPRGGNLEHLMACNERRMVEAQDDIARLRAEVDRLKADNTDLQAALDSEHASVGYNIWRFWRDKALKISKKRDAEYQRGLERAAEICEKSACDWVNGEYGMPEDQAAELGIGGFVRSAIRKEMGQ